MVLPGVGRFIMGEEPSGGWYVRTHVVELRHHLFKANYDIFRASCQLKGGMGAPHSYEAPSPTTLQ